MSKDMERRAKDKKRIRPGEDKAAAGYALPGLPGMYGTPFGPARQCERFMPCTIYKDNSPCYATVYMRCPKVFPFEKFTLIKYVETKYTASYSSAGNRPPDG